MDTHFRAYPVISPFFSSTTTTNTSTQGTTYSAVSHFTEMDGETYRHKDGQKEPTTATNTTCTLSALHHSFSFPPLSCRSCSSPLFTLAPFLCQSSFVRFMSTDGSIFTLVRHFPSHTSIFTLTWFESSQTTTTTATTTTTTCRFDHIPFEDSEAKGTSAASPFLSKSTHRDCRAFSFSFSFCAPPPSTTFLDRLLYDPLFPSVLSRPITHSGRGRIK